MKNKTLKSLTVMLVSLFLISILPSDVSATFTIGKFNMEGTLLAQYNGNSSGVWLHTEKSGSTNFYIVADPKTGSTGFQVGVTNAKGWINLSYSKLLYLTNFSFYVKQSAWNNGYACTYYFYNKTLGYLNPLVELYFSADGSGTYSKYLDYLGVLRTFSNHYTGTYTPCGFNITSTTGTCYYTTVSGTQYTGTVHNPTAISNGTRIDRIYIYTGATSGITHVIDDLNLTISDSYTFSGGGGSNPLHDFSIYNVLGSYPNSDTEGYGTLICTNHEELYNQLFSGSIYGLEIFTWNTWDTNYKTDWNMYINGFGLLPNSAYNLTIPGITKNCIVIRYDIVTSPITITNQKILLELYNPLKETPAFQTDDVDGDGLIEMKFGNTATGGNGIYDGSYTSQSTEYNYLLYYLGGNGASPENTTAYNVLDLSGQRDINSSDNSKLFYRNDTVLISYGIKDMTIQNSLKIKHPSLNISYGGFPKTIYDAKNSFGFRCNGTGNYTVFLLSNNVIVARKYFDVILNPNGNQYEVSSSPPMTFDYKTYTVYYRYFNPSGYSGYLGVYTNLSDMSSQVGIINNSIMALRYIPSNSSSNFLFMHSEKYHNHYWQLFSLVNGYYYPVGDTHIHYVIDTQSYNAISTDTIEQYINIPFKVYGSNTQVGGNVWIYINNYPWKEETGKNQFTETYSSTIATTIIFKLEWVLSNGSKILLAQSQPIQILTQPKNKNAGVSLIGPPITYILGGLLVLIGILIPLWVGRNRDKEPTVAIMLSGGLFCSLAIIAGLLPAWLIGVFLAIGVIVIVIMWLRSKLT